MGRKAWLVVVMVLLAFTLAGCGGEEPQQPEPEPMPQDLTEAEQIEWAIQARINEGEYRSTKLDRITVNENLGTEEDGDYIALVYLVFDVKNKRDTGNNMMRMYSDDLVATLASKGITNISQAAVFWEDEYNDRSLKYAYEYENGGFYITDIAGE